jgi:hypothetical protein
MDDLDSADSTQRVDRTAPAAQAIGSTDVEIDQIFILSVSDISERTQELVTEFLGLANRASQILRDLGIKAGGPPTSLPAPWGEYVITGGDLLRSSLAELFNSSADY